MAKIEGFGNLGSDPELKYVGEEQDKPVTEFRFYLKSDRRKGEDWQDRGNWFGVSVWGACAESAAKLFHKGDRIYLRGTFGTDRWADKETDDEREALAIDANLVLPYLPALESLAYKPRKGADKE